MLRWFTAGGAIRIALQQLSQTWKLRHYDVIDDVIIWVQEGNCKKWILYWCVLQYNQKSGQSDQNCRM